MSKSGIYLRAFDIVNNVMHNDFSFIEVEGGDKETMGGLVFYSDIYKTDFSSWPPKYDFEMCLVIMEWVHAVDSIGNKIYTNDLVKVKEMDTGDEWVGVVMWGNMGCAKCFDIGLDKDGNISRSCFFDLKGAKFMVIGNVFEDEDMVIHLYEKNILKKQKYIANE
jgi:hypothetical protein